MPDAAKVWLRMTKSIGKGCRQEFSKAFVKLLHAHVFILNQVCINNRGLDPFPGRWNSAKCKMEEAVDHAERKTVIWRLGSKFLEPTALEVLERVSSPSATSELLLAERSKNTELTERLKDMTSISEERHTALVAASATAVER
ncbi:hypothetical protein R1sor_004924 [Riccia sorocarpa]|uniref:Uncharacterized protein n=1 Tax=Riccia sorocarpa TaxID=122646 RepID=A0ABD3HIN1_9MARC